MAQCLGWLEDYYGIFHWRPPLRGGGGAVVYLARTHYLFQPGSAARRKFPILLQEKISHFIKCGYGTVLEIYYLFRVEYARIFFFKYSSPPPGDWMVATFSVSASTCVTLERIGE